MRYVYNAHIINSNDKSEPERLGNEITTTTERGNSIERYKYILPTIFDLTRFFITLKI